MMKEIMNGREVRNALLRAAMDIREHHEKPMDKWLTEMNASLQGSLEGCVAQHDAVAHLADLLGENCSPQPLADLAPKVDFGNWSVSDLVRAIHEYGGEFSSYDLALSSDPSGKLLVTKIIW